MKLLHLPLIYIYGLFLNLINLFVYQIKFCPQYIRRSLLHSTCYCRSSKPFRTTPTRQALSIRSRLNTDTHAQHGSRIQSALRHSRTAVVLSAQAARNPRVASALTGSHTGSCSHRLTQTFAQPGSRACARSLSLCRLCCATRFVAEVRSQRAQLSETRSQ